MLVAWGVNYEGQTNIPSNLPFAAGIAGGAEHGAAIVTDGSPFIVRVPFTQTISSGTTATLSAQAIGSLPLSYQWQFNGVNIPGATDATLNLTNISTRAGGNYSVWVTNALGAAQSPEATLTVHRTTLYFRSLPGVPALTDGNFHCEIAGLSGHGPVVVYSSTNLADWVPALTYPPVAGHIGFLDPLPAATSTRFYRAVEQ